MGRMEGKVAFLTGAGAGIAKATAKAFAREGAKVALFELDRDTGAAAEREIRDAGGDAQHASFRRRSPAEQRRGQVRYPGLSAQTGGLSRAATKSNRPSLNIICSSLHASCGLLQRDKIRVEEKRRCAVVFACYPRWFLRRLVILFDHGDTVA